MISCLVSNLGGAVLQDLAGTGHTSQVAGNTPSQYLQIVFSEDKTALQLPPLVGVWSVGVQQGSNVGEFPELERRIFRNILAEISYLNDLQVDIEKSPDEDPEFEVVERPESPDPPEESFKVKCPLFVINGVVQPGPGTDSQGGGRRSCRYQTDCYLIN